FGPAYGRDLRVGEDSGRNRPVVGRDLAAAEVRRDDPRLVLSDVRELRDAGDVPDRPDVGGGTAVLVDLQAARANRDAGLLEAEPVRVGAAAGRDEEALGLECRAVA